MRTSRVVSLVVAVAILLSGAALCNAAKPAVDFVKMVSLEELRSMKDTLKLTDDQTARYKSLRDQFQGKVKGLAEQMTTKHKELVDLVKVEQPNTSAIESKVKEILALEQQEIMASLQYFADFAKNLTKEQQTIFWAEAGKRFFKEETPKPAKEGAAPTAKEETPKPAKEGAAPTAKEEAPKQPKEGATPATKKEKSQTQPAAEKTKKQ